jgi:ADP-ribose pyrophosphatase
VPVDGEGRLLWVRQYRYAAGRSLLELPAGTLEQHEAPEATARRELVEEVGFAAAQWRELGRFFTAPGFCTEYMYAYLATDLTPAYAKADDDEDISVEPLTLDESLRRVDAGEIEDAKSIAALHFYLRKRE